jgi:hypothetical protein
VTLPSLPIGPGRSGSHITPEPPTGIVNGGSITQRPWFGSASGPRVSGWSVWFVMRT